MAKIIEGAPMLEEIKTQVKAQVQQLRAKGIVPRLTVVVVGDNPASAAYIRGKKKDCEDCGIDIEVRALPSEISQAGLLAEVEALSADPAVHGMLVQLPLPSHIDADAVMRAVSPLKDVDGFTAENMGRLLLGHPRFIPCTAEGVVHMLRQAGVPLAGKHCVVIGRSNIVGKPLAVLLTAENATVTLCHSYTEGLPAIARTADVLVSAVGQEGFVKQNMVKPGAVVVDVGINRGADGRLHGDVDFDAVAQVASAVTPVPGGVGLLTRGILLCNTLRAVRL